tara:strand:+ start:819 stop:1517 length:699 start_codon:yes stop_codon:yes gene_type:complete
LEQLQRQLQRHKDSGDSTYVDYYAREIAKMTGTNPETGETRKRRNESYGRHCSYCRERGHSRRTCPTLKEDQRNYRRMASVVRRDLLARMKEHGFGVGSLLTLATNEWVEGEYVEVKNAYLVTGIEWDNITPHNKIGQHCVKAVSVKDPSQQPNLSMPTEVTGSEESRWSAAPVLVGPTPLEKINPPPAWTAGAGAENTNDFFEKGSTRQHFWWRNEGSKLLDRWAGIEPTE